MKVVIERVYLGEETLSSLYVYDLLNKIIFKCKGLEPAWKENKHNISCIPEETYWVHKEPTSPHHEYPHFRVENVTDRNGVLWHSGNYMFDTLGCLLVGDSFGDRNQDGLLDVLNSKETLKKLYDLLPDRFQVTYKKKQ